MPLIAVTTRKTGIARSQKLADRTDSPTVNPGRAVLPSVIVRASLSGSRMKIATIGKATMNISEASAT